MASPACQQYTILPTDNLGSAPRVQSPIPRKVVDVAGLPPLPHAELQTSPQIQVQAGTSSKVGVSLWDYSSIWAVRHGLEDETSIGDIVVDNPQPLVLPQEQPPAERGVHILWSQVEIA